MSKAMPGVGRRFDVLVPAKAVAVRPELGDLPLVGAVLWRAAVMGA